MSNSRPIAHPRGWARDPAELERHPLGHGQAQPVEVLHACPECPLGAPKPFCLVCLGAGNVTADRLDRHMRMLELEDQPGSIRIAGPVRQIAVEPL